MTSTAEKQRKQEVIESLAAGIAERLTGEEAAQAGRFVRHYYAPVSPQDVLADDRENLLGAALALWRFSARRPGGTARVRVFNPRPEEDGFHSPHTVAQVVHDDMPFLVDSVTGELNRRGRTVHLVVHPVVVVVRDREGGRVAGPDAEGWDGALRESLMHVELDQETSPEALVGLADALERVLADVRTVVAAWRPMRRRLGEVVHRLEEEGGSAAPEDAEETRAFLLWLDENHFTFLGTRTYDLEVVGGRPLVRVHAGSGLGILEGTSSETFPLSPETARPSSRNPLLVVSKAGRRSTVHRPVHMDYVGVRRLDATGEVRGGWSFVGLLTSGVYHTSATSIPLVARKIHRVMERAGLAPQGHDAKALLHILETFPRDELFQMTEDELYETSLGVLQLQERQRLALFVRKDSAERFVSCLVYVPRDRYNTDLRQRIGEILAATFQGSISALYTQVADSPLARAHFIVRTTPGRVPAYEVSELEERLARATLTWTDRLERELVASRGEQEGLTLMARYGEAFPVSYRERFDPAAALDDLDEIEVLLAGGGLRTLLYRPHGTSGHEVRFNIFHTGHLRPLSDVLPMLENMGLRVVSEMPYQVTPAEAPEEVWLRVLVLSSARGEGIDPAAIREKFQQVFARLWWEEVENDPFNLLVLAARLDWRQVVVLRAYARYLKQTGFTFGQTYMAETLGRHPEVTRLLIELFEARFDPAAGGPEGGLAQAGRSAREERCQVLAERIRTALNAVTQLDEDRILRRFRNLVEATLRTNHFQRTADGSPKPYLALKLDGRRVQGLPAPRPWCEIFVYSPRTEAVHLRGGPVARGGVRWSDRPQDFRTEILGLMKAQMVKNTVIVPVGAKGGFIVKGPRPADPEGARAEAIESYRTMIRGLLDLTDNLEGGSPVAPPRVVRWDGDDPYLVVAADKGTATFSDIANGVAAEYGFWLGDAFASGGSAGYDHKKMGITAKGAWESVKRHFREMGRDIQSTPFTVVGIGDMSGDVFGNGMLLSKTLRLVGAFNHQHIFVDPDPDPAASWAERERLFRLERSTWADYDRRRLSAGGGIFDRSAKAIPLSPQIRRLLGLEEESAPPDELIRALLTSPVDLLWFGGIGTFVKASGESHSATGDRQNDEARVDARGLRCKVVGEGANLGLTQRGRIELALAGGRLNTDFIDNSGGVDCSDHEVNFKILLGDAIARGRMSRTERDELLATLSDEVCRLVLRDNYLQTQALSVAEQAGPALLDEQLALIRELERGGKLDRALEALPDDETLAERRAGGRGLTRPEIAVLLAYAKIHLFEALLASDLPEDPLLVQDLFRYFPAPLTERFRAEVERHRLRREIIATHVTNSMVNRVGPSFVTRLAAQTGRSIPDIARAYTVSRDTFGLRRLWDEIEELDLRVPGDLQMAMLLEVGRLVERGTRWFLARGPALSISDLVARFQPAVSRLAEGLDALLPEEDRRALEMRAEHYRRQGVPEGLAHRMAHLELLGSACDVVEIAHAGDGDLELVGRIFFDLGARFGLEGLRAGVKEAAGESAWAKAAADSLTGDLFRHQSTLTRGVLETGPVGEGADGALARWLAARAGAVARLDQLLTELQAAAAPDLAAYLVLEHQLRALAGG